MSNFWGAVHFQTTLAVQIASPKPEKPPNPTIYSFNNRPSFIKKSVPSVDGSFRFRACSGFQTTYCRFYATSNNFKDNVIS